MGEEEESGRVSVWGLLCGQRWLYQPDEEREIRKRKKEIERWTSEKRTRREREKREKRVSRERWV